MCFMFVLLCLHQKFQDLFIFLSAKFWQCFRNSGHLPFWGCHKGRWKGPTMTNPVTYHMTNHMISSLSWWLISLSIICPLSLTPLDLFLATNLFWLLLIPCDFPLTHFLISNSIWLITSMGTIVQGEHSQHMSQCLTIEFPAKQLKSRKESGKNMSICYFCLLGACFIIFTYRHPYRKGQKGWF